MKHIYHWTTAVALLLSTTACSDLPEIGVETDLYNIPLPEAEAIVEVETKDVSVSFLHDADGVYGLHTEKDFERIRSKYLTESPWKEGYEALKNSNCAQLDCKTYPTEEINRPSSGGNFANAARGAAMAYQLGLRWRIEQNDEYAQLAVSMLNSWAKTCKKITGDTNRSLASGIYGYEFAMAGELLRGYDGWEAQDFAAYQQWMLDVFYPENKDFLVRHHGTNDTHYWSNWPLANLASTMAIGILADRRDIYNEAITHLQTGKTNGRITNAIYHVYTGKWSNFAQWQESGRDQSHTIMGIGIMGTIFQMAYNQGDDFFKYGDNMFLKACEYVACCNYTGDEYPYTAYTWMEWKGTEARPRVLDKLNSIGDGTGEIRPVWALPYNHYSVIMKIDPDQCKYTKIAVAKAVPEGGPQSGSHTSAFDHPGFGTLMYTLSTEE